MAGRFKRSATISTLRASSSYAMYGSCAGGSRHRLSASWRLTVLVHATCVVVVVAVSADEDEGVNEDTDEGVAVNAGEDAGAGEDVGADEDADAGADVDVGAVVPTYRAHVTRAVQTTTRTTLTTMQMGALPRHA
jgi:hypothetical protein